MAAEAEALCDHTVDLSLSVLLTDALIRRKPRQRPIHVVVVRLPYDKQPSRELDYTHEHTLNKLKIHF